MPGLAQSLEGQDLSHLQMVAELWNLEIRPRNASEAIQQASELIIERAAQPELVAALPAAAQDALRALVAAGGRLPWAQFTRQYGELRQMGPARRDKEQPQRNPQSVTEMLWYRALVARAFFDAEDGPLEFAYLPDELLAVLPIESKREEKPFGRAARPSEREIVSAASDAILDEACTLLAGRRLGMSEAEMATAEDWRMPPATLTALLQAARILDKQGKPIPEATRLFLAAERGEALGLLVKAWLASAEFNELRQMPGLQSEGGWQNDALAARQKVLDYAHSAPAGEWWFLPSVVADIKARQPDFQRPAGDYDSWYLRDANGNYLRGFAHWDAVDGALVAYLIRGPMHWLGLVDLAAAAEGQPAIAFRWTRRSAQLLRGETVELPKESEKITIDSQGKIQVPRLAGRTLRYQIARFGDWLPRKRGAYYYQVSARSLNRAQKQGLEVRQLLAVLKTHSSAALPPNLLQALKRWEQHGSQAQLEQVLVLRVGSAAALKALRASKAARYLGDPLGPTAILVKAGAAQQVLQTLVELGYLGELEQDS
jgi:hypothetical protein